MYKYIYIKFQKNLRIGQNLCQKVEFIFTRNENRRKEYERGGTRATLIGALIVPDAISS